MVEITTSRYSKNLMNKRLDDFKHMTRDAQYNTSHITAHAVKKMNRNDLGNDSFEFSQKMAVYFCVDN